jgi:hypothetical protein
MAAAFAAISASIVSTAFAAAMVSSRRASNARSAMRSASSTAASLTSDDNGGMLNVPLLDMTTNSPVAGWAEACVPHKQTIAAATAVRRRISSCMID